VGPGAAVADLSRALVADEIARVRNERWSGVLALSQGEVSKGLYFLEGEIVFAASTVEEDRLGACLFRAGRLSESQFRTAMREVEASGYPLGYVLVESRILTPQELSGALDLSVAGIRRWKASDTPLPEPLASDIRNLVSLTSARYVIMPLETRVDVTQGQRKGALHLLLIDARTARVLWTGDVEGQSQRDAAIVREALSPYGFRMLSRELAGLFADMVVSQ